MYELQFLSSAKKDLTKLEFAAQKLIKSKLITLCENPELLKNNIKALKGEYKDKYRLRVHQYRIVFQIIEGKLVIVIVRIGHRKEVY